MYHHVFEFLMTFQDCPENPACIVFQDCVICNTMPDGRNCSGQNANCTLSMIDGDVNAETYIIEGS